MISVSRKPYIVPALLRLKGPSAGESPPHSKRPSRACKRRRGPNRCQPETPRNPLFLSGFGDGAEVGRIQAGPADEHPVHIRRREEFGRVRRLDASPVEDRHLGRPLGPPAFPQSGSEYGVGPRGVFGSGRLPRPDRPHRLVGHQEPLGRGVESREPGVELPEQHGLELPGAPFFELLADARRFVAGRTIDDGVRTARRLQTRGFAVALDHLGEAVSAEAEARRAADTFLRVSESVSPKTCRRSEWPTRTCEAPASAAIPTESSPVKAPDASQWTFCTPIWTGPSPIAWRAADSESAGGKIRSSTPSNPEESNAAKNARVSAGP